MITWGDVIDIILKTFDISQTKLSSLMGYEKSAISKIRHGKLTPNLSNDNIFYLVFYPANTDSPAYKYGDTNNLALCLEEVKYTISKPSFSAVREDMKDVWDETDYKKFVCKLLSRAKKGPSSKIKPKERESENSNDNGEDTAAFGSANNEILDTKPEKAPPKEIVSRACLKIEEMTDF